MKTTANIGTIDRAVRAALGIVLALWAMAGGPALAWLGLILLATAAFSWCPVYRVLGLNTRERPRGGRGPGTSAPSH